MSSEKKYIVRFSDESQFEAIKQFYSNDLRRTSNVFLRTDSLLMEQAKQGRFVTVWKNGALVAASSLYILANGEKIGCEIHEGGQEEWGRVGELGSVLRIGKDPDDPDIEKGFWRLILFGIPMIAALKYEYPIDIILAGVKNNACGTRTKSYIQKAPFKWECINPAQGFLEADRVAVNDQDITDCEHYRAYVPDIVPLAKTLLKICEEGRLKDTRTPDQYGYNPDLDIPMDLSPLGIEPTLRCIVRNAAMLEKTFRPISWCEAGRVVNNLLPSHNIFNNAQASLTETAKETLPRRTIGGIQVDYQHSECGFRPDLSQCANLTSYNR